MYSKISGFSDEISRDIETQFKVLSRLGIKYFVPRDVNGKNISELTLAEVENLRQAIGKYGIKVSSIGSPIGKSKITDDFEIQKNKLIHTIQIAKILGARYIRVFSYFIDQGEHEKWRSEVLFRMKEMTHIAQENDIILLHENEKGIYGDVANRCKDIIDYVSSPYLRAVFDMANFVQCGEQTYPYAYNLLRPYIEYMHIKDARYIDNSVVPAGYGDGKAKDIIRELKENGYQGFFSIEPHLGNFNVSLFPELAQKMENLPDGGEGRFTLAYNIFMEILEN